LQRKLWVTGLATLPIIPPTILLNFHDEAYFNGHFAIIAHLQNGTYPPRYLYEPSLPLRYHYGFDLAGAIVTGLLRVRLDQAIDILTLTLWPLMFLLLWRVGERVGGRRAGLLVAFAVCFSTGWCALCSVNEARTNPPFLSYFFQHPWSIGVPIFCLVILQRAALARLDSRFFGLLALVCSLVMLSLCQAVLFIAIVVALGINEAWKLMRHPNRTEAYLFLSLGASLVGAKLAGGFFVSGPFPQAGELFGTGFYLRHFSDGHAVLGQLLWNFETFGLLLILGILGLLRVAHDKVFWTILALFPFVVINFLGYRHSWDIVKFATVSSISLSIGSGLTLLRLLDWSNTRRRRTIFSVLVVALLWQGVYYPFIFLQDYDPGGRSAFSKQMIKPYFSSAYPVDQDDARAVSFLRTRMGPSEIVYRTERKSEPYAIWGGLPTEASVYPALPGITTHMASAKRSLRSEEISPLLPKPGSTDC